MDKAGACAYARAHALRGSKGSCAHYVRDALMTGGGVPLHDWPDCACKYKGYLERFGFEQVPVEGYTPEPGDVCVLDAYIGGNSAGHICIFDGSNWVSDFVQRDYWGGLVSAINRCRTSFIGTLRKGMQGLAMLVRQVPFHPLPAIVRDLPPGL